MLSALHRSLMRVMKFGGVADPPCCSGYSQANSISRARILVTSWFSAAYLEAAINTAAVARHHGVEAFVNIVADDGHADEHHRDHRQPAAQAALAGGAGPVM